MAKETLTCETGNHTWTRETTRGRKPRHCPEHIPVVTPSVLHSVDGLVTLNCEIGNHEWKRPVQRGRVPDNCPEHKPALVITPSQRNENGKVELTCAFDGHTWERAPQRGRKPVFCPNHSSATRSVAPSVSLVEWDPEDELLIEVEGDYEAETTEAEQKQLLTAAFNPVSDNEAKLAHSRERATLLEGRLKERGTHISQQDPYILYRKVSEVPSRHADVEPTVTWERVTEHSPLAQAQFINKNEKDFVDGKYRYERNGKVVIL